MQREIKKAQKLEASPRSVARDDGAVGQVFSVSAGQNLSVWFPARAE
jgi:hypothetical protein